MSDRDWTIHDAVDAEAMHDFLDARDTFDDPIDELDPRERAEELERRARIARHRKPKGVPLIPREDFIDDSLTVGPGEDWPF